MKFVLQFPANRRGGFDGAGDRHIPFIARDRIVILYGITKDRWKWRRILKGTGLVGLGLVLLAVLVGAGVYVYQQMPAPLTRQIEYAGIRLGMRQDEVLYIKGYPPVVLADDSPGSPWKSFLVLETSKIEAGKSVHDYKRWSYNEYKRNINVIFDDARTAVTTIQCYSEDKLGHCPAIAGIDDGASELEVLRVLGNNPQAKIGGTTKSLTYPEFGIRLNLAKAQVYLLEVSSLY